MSEFVAACAVPAAQEPARLRRVQWRHFWNHQQYTPVHYYLSAPAGYGGQYETKEVAPGVLQTLCGKRFSLESSEFDEAARGRICKACTTILSRKERQ